MIRIFRRLVCSTTYGTFIIDLSYRANRKVADAYCDRLWNLYVGTVSLAA